jgi:hypothetical protein
MGDDTDSPDIDCAIKGEDCEEEKRPSRKSKTAKR